MQVWHPWLVASNLTVRQDYSPGHTLFSTFSAVCWLFGKRLATRLSAEPGPLPLGLISNNWGGTKLEVWTPPAAYPACGREAERRCTNCSTGLGEPSSRAKVPLPPAPKEIARTVRKRPRRPTSE